MANDILLNKAEIIERCLRRLDELYRNHEQELETNHDRQDAILMNLQRACEAAIDAAMHIVRTQRLGLPQTSKDVFAMLTKAGLLDTQLGARLQAMVGFRNIAVHNYREISMTVLRDILEKHLGDFREYSRVIVAMAYR